MNLNIEGIKSGTSNLVMPARALGDAMIDTTEKMVALQLDSCKAYTDIAFRQLKKVPEVRSLEQVGDLLWGQIGPISEFNKQILNDWKSLMTLNTEFNQTVKSVFSASQEAVPTDIKSAKETPKTSESTSKNGKEKITSRAKTATTTN